MQQISLPLCTHSVHIPAFPENGRGLLSTQEFLCGRLGPSVSALALGPSVSALAQEAAADGGLSVVRALWRQIVCLTRRRVSDERAQARPASRPAPRLHCP